MTKLIDKAFDWVDKASPVKILTVAIIVMVATCFVYGEILDDMLGPISSYK